MYYKRILMLPGILETLPEINEAYMRETGSPEPWSEDVGDAWRAWIEHENGNTYVLAEMP